MFQFLSSSDGDSSVVIYLAKERGMKRLPPSRNILIQEDILAELQKKYGQSNIKVVKSQLKIFGKCIRIRIDNKD